MDNLKFTDLERIDRIVKKAVIKAIEGHAARGELISISKDGKVITLPAAEFLKNSELIKTEK